LIRSICLPLIFPFPPLFFPCIITKRRSSLHHEAFSKTSHWVCSFGGGAPKLLKLISDQSASSFGIWNPCQTDHLHLAMTNKEHADPLNRMGPQNSPHLCPRLNYPCFIKARTVASCNSRDPASHITQEAIFPFLCSAPLLIFLSSSTIFQIFKSILKIFNPNSINKKFPLLFSFIESRDVRQIQLRLRKELHALHYH